MGHGYLGIDLGTQGLSVIYTSAEMQVLATGEAGYDMVSGLDSGCYEQRPADWERALQIAMQSLREALERSGMPLEVAAIGISGQMHGEVQVVDDLGTARNTRLWCDSRNEAEAEELTGLLGVKMPKRMTAVRWLWSQRQPNAAIGEVKNLTTPGGWLAQRLTGQRTLGLGDASGMFPIDQATLDYDQRLLDQYDRLVEQYGLPGGRLRELLPLARAAGQDGGCLNAHGSACLGLPLGTPVAPAEGDQPAALAGSLIGQAGMVSMSFGTSVCANSVGDRTFQGVSPAIDHFCAADGKPINMVWLRNGTTYMNAIVRMVGNLAGSAAGQGTDVSGAFRAVIPELLASPPDCGGLLALPFMDDEPGLGVSRGGTAMLVGLNDQNARPGHAARAALLATIFNLRLGCEALLAQGFPLQKIILSGGLTKSPALAQVIADGFDLPVSILDSGSEGSAWGAALTAKYRHQSLAGNDQTWADFLARQATGTPTTYRPDASAVGSSTLLFQRYKRLVAVLPALDSAVNDG
jgi:sugar (pentulose or hexulose) kinase